MRHDVMRFDSPGSETCHYAGSRLAFRAPKRSLAGDHVIVVGSTETYGKYIEHPFPDLLEKAIGLPCVNLGCVDAGADAFLKNFEITEICQRAQAVVVQVMGAQNQSNRFYTVNMYRNNRLDKVSGALKLLYPEAPFEHFVHVRQMLAELYALDPERFIEVQNELRASWLARMRLLVEEIQRPVIFLWFANHVPQSEISGLLHSDPMFISREMMDEIKPLAHDVVEVCTPHTTVEGKVFADAEAAIAANLPGVDAHKQVADALTPALQAALKSAKETPAPFGDGPAHSASVTELDHITDME